MDLLISFLKNSIGQKIVVALTGLGLCLFVFIHMLGNLFILAGPSAYNKYAHNLHEFPLLVPLEIGLLSFFLAHILLAVLLMIKNKKSQGSVGYSQRAKASKKLPLVHRFLWFQGAVLMVFLILHLLSFKFGPHYETLLEGEPVRDIYRLVVEEFKKPLYTIGYSFVLFILFIHLWRGLTASLETLGLGRPGYLALIKKLSLLFALAVSFGFLMPIWYIFLWL